VGLYNSLAACSIECHYVELSEVYWKVNLQGTLVVHLAM